MKFCSFNVSLYIFLSDKIDEDVRVERARSSRGKFSVPVDRICEFGSVSLNTERIIETEHETNDEPLLSSLTWELWISNDETKRKE